MNYDKQLAKYAKQLDNPKYFGKILKILDKADKANYKFKNFNVFDLELITGEIYQYYSAITTDEEDRRMVHYFNKACFLISDKNYILCVTESLFNAYFMYVKMRIVMLLARTKQLLQPDIYIEIGNVNRDIFFCRGALQAAKCLNTDVFELENYYVK